MEPSGFQGLLLASYNIAPQGGRDNVAEGQSLAQARVKAPLAPPQGKSHALPAASLGRNGSEASCGRHMPEPACIACATAPPVPLPRRLQHRSASSAHMFYASQDRSVNACTIAGARLHPSLRASAGASAASFTIARHLHLLPKSKRSLVCLIF